LLLLLVVVVCAWGSALAEAQQLKQQALQLDHNAAFAACAAPAAAPAAAAAFVLLLQVPTRPLRHLVKAVLHQ
jgi:hypothetical protein